MNHAFNYIHFCMHDNNVLVKPVRVKVMKEGECEYRVVAFFFALFLPFLLWKKGSYELSGVKDVRGRGAQPLQNLS